jgi:hypothetical protein
MNSGQLAGIYFIHWRISSDEVIHGEKSELFKTGFWRECNIEGCQMV